MSKKASSQPKEKTAKPPKDIVLVRLEDFHVLQNARTQSFFGWIPALLILLVLTDWLIGSGTFSRDTFRMTGVLTVALILLVIQILFNSLPKVLETIWRRELIHIRSEQDGADRFLEYLEQFKSALNAKYEWIIAVVFAIGALFSTFPFQYYIKTNRFPYDIAGMLIYYFGSQAAVIAPVIGLIVGALAWRIGVIAYFIGIIGDRFPLKIQINHNDQCGGFKPLGDLAFKIAAIILIPSIFLAVWGFITTFVKDPAFQVYVVLWGGLFRQLLVLLILMSVFAFIQPLYKIHLRMEENARKIRGELDSLSREIETLSYELRSQAFAFNPQQGEEKLRKIEFMKKVYDENNRIPTWPFDWKTVLRFSSAQVLPLLSLLGTSGPIVDIIKGLFALGH